MKIKKPELLENERICEDCGCIYHIHAGCCSNLPFGVTKENYELIKQVIEVQNKVWAQLTDEQKSSWYVDGTIGFTTTIIELLGIKENTLSEQEHEYCSECLTYEPHIWELGNKKVTYMSNDLHQMYDTIRLVWNLLSIEQKTSIQEAGTVGFVDNVLYLLGYDLHMDVGVEEYTSCVELVYTLQQVDTILLAHKEVISSVYKELSTLSSSMLGMIDDKVEDLHAEFVECAEKVKELSDYLKSKI